MARVYPPAVVRVSQKLRDLTIAIALVTGLFTGSAVAGDYYVSTTGSASAAGTLADPWNIEYGFNNNVLGGGDTLWIIGGTYVAPRTPTQDWYRVRLSGDSSSSRLTIRNYNNQRATIDGGIRVDDASRGNFLTIWGLEVIVSEHLDPATRDRTVIPWDNPNGGINVYYGEDVKFINNVVTAAGTGMGLWNNVNGVEAYGNIIYDNGYFDATRYHGPGIYSQNHVNNDDRIYENNILLENYSNAFQIYGSSTAQVNHHIVTRNIVSSFPGSWREFFIMGNSGGPTNPHTDLHVVDNILYNTFIQLGFGSGYGDNLSATDNHIYRGGIVQSGANLTDVTVSGNEIWNTGDAVPSAPQVFVQENEYENDRAHVAIFKWGSATSVAVDLSSFLSNGNDFYVLDPKDFYGPALFSGVFNGSLVNFPVPEEFEAFIIIAQPLPEHAASAASRPR